MNEIRIFQNSAFGELEVREIEGKVYFPATACAKMLGYENPQEAVREKCKGVRKMLTPTNGGNQTKNYIPEGDLYRLIVHSRLPAAEQFERWVFDEVLPSIRQTGGYVADLAKMVQEATRAIITAALPVVIEGALAAVAQSAGRLPDRLNAPVKQRKRRTYTIIGSLDADLRQVVEDMILEKRHTYQEICNILQDEYGICITKSSVHRYAMRLMDERESRGMRPLD